MNSTTSSVNTWQVPLTKGEYSPFDAQELISSLATNEKKFHVLQNFINEIRHEKVCDQAKKNINRLEDASQELEDIFANLKHKHGSVRIETIVKITSINLDI